MHIYIYIYIGISINTYVYIYIYIYTHINTHFLGPTSYSLLFAFSGGKASLAALDPQGSTRP